MRFTDRSASERFEARAGLRDRSERDGLAVAPAGAEDALLRAFESFKDTNDERLAALERKGGGDVLLEEKVARIDRAMNEQKAALERIAMSGRRPGLAADAAPTSEHKSAWSSYLRRGDESALATFEAKALAVGTNAGADGGA